MVIVRALYKMLLPLFFWTVASACAAAEPENVHFIGRYDFSFAGISLAAAELAIEETASDYSLHLVLVSKGVVNLFTHHRSDTMTSGKHEGNHFHPRLYESHYWTKNKPRHLKLAFNAKGAITEEIVEPPEDRTERAEVPHSLKDGALDPLSILMTIPRGDTAPHVFDAKHLWEGKAILMPTNKPLIVNNHEVAGYILSRTPLAGMTQKETKEYNKGEPPVYFFVSADDRHIPVYMNLSLYMSRLSGSLTKECKTWDECKVN